MKLKEKIPNHFLRKSIFSFIILSILVISVSAFFISNEAYIGPLFIILGIIAIFFLKSYGFTLQSTFPDIVFGAIDNGILVFAAILGGAYAGVFGAVIGGAAGNTLTDGLGGLVEGHMAEKLREKNINDKRTSLSTMLGKIIGCLFGAGVGLLIIWIIKLF